MASRRRFCLIVAASATLAATCAIGQADEQKAVVQHLPADSNPPVPPGLKVTCLQGPPGQPRPASTCPVVKYQGVTTWAYSYIDNRVSLALVSYDANNKVIRNVDKPGARYVFDARSNSQQKIVVFFGQGNMSVTVPWNQLGAN